MPPFARGWAVRGTALGLGLVVAVAAVGNGCGSDPDMPKLGKVGGTVTYKGKNVDAGHVVFTPVQGKGGDTGQIGTGEIRSDGSYTLTTFTTGDGAILGEHVVTVQVRPSGTDAYPMPKPDGSIDYKLPKNIAPSRYAKVETSPLRCTVPAGGTTYNIEIKD